MFSYISEFYCALFYKCVDDREGQFEGQYKRMIYFIHVSGARLQQCGSGYVEVVENTADFFLTCDQYSDTVIWEYLSPGIPTANSIGKCGTSCQLESAVSPDYFTLTKLSPSSSRLDIAASAIVRATANTSYRCGGAPWCVVDIVGE